MKSRAPMFILIIVLILTPTLFYIALWHSAFIVAEKGVIPVSAKDDPGGVVEIYYQLPGSTTWYGPYNTTTTETIYVPYGSNVKYVFIPFNGFGFYEAVGTLTITSTSYTFTNVTSPITETAYFPVKLTIINFELWDYITTSHIYYASFIGILAYDNNMSPVPPSVASYLAPYMQLYISVKPVGNSTSVSGTHGLQESGSIIYLEDSSFFTVYDPNGLAQKYATIEFNSPNPKLYYSHFAWSANDWAWGLEVTVDSGNSIVEWQMPYSQAFYLSGYVSKNSLASLYFPSGASVTFTDLPVSGYAFTGWTFITQASTGKAGIATASTSNPYTITLPSTSFAQAYTGPYYALDAETAPTSITFSISAPHWAVSTQVSIYLTMPNGSVLSKSATLSAPGAGSLPATATIQWQRVPMGSYSWYVSPSSIAKSVFGAAEAAGAEPQSGSFTLSSENNGSVVQDISYVFYAYNVTFEETGLPHGMPWWVVLGGVNESATAPNPITFFNVPAYSSISYSADSPVLVNGNTKYQAANAKGTIAVDSDIVQRISYSTYYLVNVSYRTGLGTSNPASVWVPAGHTEEFELTPEEDYYVPQPFSSYIKASSSALSVQYSSVSMTASGNTLVYDVPVSVNGPGTVYVDAQWFDFVEYIMASGYPPSGWQYSLYQNGKEVSNSTVIGSTASISVPGYDYQANSYYEYEIVFPVIRTASACYVPSIASLSNVKVVSQSSGSVTFEITGNAYNGSTIIHVSYEPYYAMTINAGPGGSISWSIYSGSVYGSTGGTVSAGTSQTVYVAGGTGLELIDKPDSGYEFMNWCFTGYAAPAQGYSQNSNPIVVLNTGSAGEVSATYQYSTYIRFTVSSAQDISFTITLSNGMSWSGNTLTASSHVFYLPYGTYSWKISPVEYNASVHGVPVHYVATPSSGSATTNATIQISYVQQNSAFEYTWYESGLPSGTQWSITVGSTTYTSTGSSISEWFSSGQTYSWNASASGYIAEPSSGSFSQSGSQTITFYTYPAVSISASPSSGQEPLTVTYIATASGGSGQYEYNFYYEQNSGSYVWSGWQTSNFITYTYTGSGVYSAMVEVKDMVTGATASSQYASVTVTQQPLQVSISASPTSGSAPLAVSFTASMSGGNGQYSYTWYFGDGATCSGSTKSSTISITHTYTGTGTYWAELYVKSGGTGAWSNQIEITVSGQLTINSFNASPNPVAQGNTITFSWSFSGGSAPYLVSITDSMGLISYSEQTSSASGSYKFTYSNAGADTVTLTVTDSAGDQASASIAVTVNPPANTYSVTFTESGLPAEDGFGNPVTWYVKLNGQRYSAQAGQSITVSGLQSGQSYSWSAESPVVVRESWHYTAKFYAKPSAGSVSGATTVYISYGDPAAAGGSPLLFVAFLLMIAFAGTLMLLKIFYA